ncbi:MAG TPA: aldose 1-epimerase [Acidobacteriota bacterium]|nr:aldose 1-epimerase [Acidobacteriota bacterium]
MKSGNSLFSAAKLIQSDTIEAVFLPEYGMLGASLQFHGVEILRKIEDLETSARRGSSVGIPILYPWANRLYEFEFEVAGKKIQLDRSSPMIHLDEKGLPLHGVPWAQLKWHLRDVQQDQLSAELNWTTPVLLQILPFPHDVKMNAVAQANTLKIETQITAYTDLEVPISFGFHPYIGIPELDRSQWKLKLPEMKKLVLNERRIPTGEIQEFAGYDAELGSNEFDHGFELLDTHTEFSIEGAGWKISIHVLNGYTHAQVFAPPDKEFIALEPMTAPTNALVSKQNLRILKSGETFSASFAVVVDKSL